MAARKRLVDVLLGSLLAVAAAPLILVLAIGAAVSFRAWPFFVQERVGRGGRSFRLAKIRSLPVSAPAYADKYAIRAVRNSRFGTWLRASHLDELPQLFLVPLGRMSLVGPRPEMAHLLAEVDQRFVAARSLVRPGCTGLWQLSPDSGKLISESPASDIYYLRYGNLRLDLWILWRTALMMLRLGGRVVLADAPDWTAGGTYVDDELLRGLAARPRLVLAAESASAIDIADDVIDVDAPSLRTGT